MLSFVVPEMALLILKILLLKIQILFLQLSDWLQTIHIAKDNRNG